MKIRKISITLFIGLIALFQLAIMASAVTVTDDTDDVYDGLLETFVSKPYIDITKVTYELSGDTVTLTMTVVGNIVNSEYIRYSIWTNKTRVSGYTAQYINGTSYVLKDMTPLSDFEVSISQENTIIFTFTVSDTSEIVDIVGGALEFYEDFINSCIDYAPDDYLWNGDDEPVDNGDNDGDEGGGTSGFEAIIFIAATVVVIILLKKKN